MFRQYSAILFDGAEPKQLKHRHQLHSFNIRFSPFGLTTFDESSDICFQPCVDVILDYWHEFFFSVISMNP